MSDANAKPFGTHEDDQDLLFYGDWYGEINDFLGRGWGVGYTEGGPLVKAKWQDAYSVHCVASKWAPLPQGEE